MSWARRVQPIKVGDKVAYSAAFLRLISCFTGDLPHGRSTVTAIHVVSPEVILAEINWGGNPEIPTRVNVRNLDRVMQRGRGHD